MDTRPDLLGFEPPALEAALAAHFEARGQPSYRVRQARAWLLERDVASIDERTDLPAAEREALAAAFHLTSPAAARTDRSADGTVKHLRTSSSWAWASRS